MSQNKKVRWGIISTGWIASCFAKALNGVPEAEIVGVASRKIETANEFGDKYKIPKRYASYEELAQDPDIDIIYIATPHSHHRDNAILCLKNNKSILVEKAFTINAKEAKEVIELAKSKNLFVMEAMWTRFFPATQKAKELVATKAIGDIRYITADLSFNAIAKDRNDPEGRLYNPALAGGALLDVGVYVVSYASNILGAQLTNFESDAKAVDTIEKGLKIDERFSIFGKYPNNVTAFLSGSFDSEPPREVLIVGSLGYIRVPIFHCPRKLIVKTKDDDAEKVLDFPWPAGYEESYDQNGLIYEAQAVTKYLLEGKKDSDIMPINETLQIMETMDALRAKWGVVYPREK